MIAFAALFLDALDTIGDVATLDPLIANQFRFRRAFVKAYACAEWCPPVSTNSVDKRSELPFS
jgi:hypothetical protein